MKAVLEFDLPQDDHEFRLASSAKELASALWDIDELLRSVVKYGRDPVSTIEECRSMIGALRNTFD